MARWGNCDYRQLQKLRENLDRLQSADLENFCRDTSKELAARLLSLVIPATPVGNYKTEVKVTAKRDSKHHKKGDVYTKRVNRSGKMGGTLRRGWTARTEGEAAGGQGHPTADQAKAYAEVLPISKQGTTYVVEVINPVHYASYVEFGHHTPGGGWKEGKHFLTISEQDLRALAPALIEKKLEALLREVFRV